MAPKLPIDVIDGRLAEIRDYVEEHLSDLGARGATSLRAVFALGKTEMKLVSINSCGRMKNTSPRPTASTRMKH